VTAIPTVAAKAAIVVPAHSIESVSELQTSFRRRNGRNWSFDPKDDLTWSVLQGDRFELAEGRPLEKAVMDFFRDNTELTVGLPEGARLSISKEPTTTPEATYIEVDAEWDGHSLPGNFVVYVNGQREVFQVHRQVPYIKGWAECTPPEISSDVAVQLASEKLDSQTTLVSAPVKVARMAGGSLLDSSWSVKLRDPKHRIWIVDVRVCGGLVGEPRSEDSREEDESGQMNTQSWFYRLFHR
jgi:hypothetical protein